MPGACDSHVHVVGDHAIYPWVASRAYTAPPAPVEALRAVAEPAGVGRFVIVQPSFYGTDNRATLDALDALGPAGRGVAVVDPDVDDATLQDMDARGVRGLRINLYSVMAEPAAPLEARFGPVRDVARRMGWHVQVIAPARALVGAAAMLAEAGVSVVIDHYGLPGTHDPASEIGRHLVGLARQPNVWFKLSAPSRISLDPLEVEPPAAWVHALLEAAPDRTVWGSDWPHTPFHATVAGHAPALDWRPIPYAALVERFRAALPAGAEQAVMAGNPARLYGFV